MVILLMGVTGAGKTTVGEALAQQLHWKFADADNFHSAANVAKMRAGIPLDDADRAPWLRSLHDAISEWIRRGTSVVLACSALKDSYRRQLVIDPDVKLVYLHGSPELIAARLQERHGHYMNPGLLASQLETLEEPSDAVIVDIDKPVDEIAKEIRKALDV